eukprot:UN27508
MKRSRMYRRRTNVSGQSPESPRFTLDGLSREAYDSYLRKVNENHEYFHKRCAKWKKSARKHLRKYCGILKEMEKEIFTNLKSPDLHGKDPVADLHASSKRILGIAAHRITL